jgi:RHS repeat-associated protein
MHDFRLDAYGHNAENRVSCFSFRGSGTNSVLFLARKKETSIKARIERSHREMLSEGVFTKSIHRSNVAASSALKPSHFGAREGATKMGRWTNKDPIGFAGGDTDVYAYVGNDPVNLTDPSGKEHCDARKVLGFKQTELAERLAVAPETVSRGETGGQAFDRSVQLAVLAMLEQVHRGEPLDLPTPAKQICGFQLRIAC